MSQFIPLSNSPNQTIQPVLVVNGQSLTLTIFISYNINGGFWVMNIADQFGNPLVLSVPLVTGVWPAANILAPFDYLQIGSAYVVNVNGGTSDFPDTSGLGTAFQLLWDDNPSFAAGDNVWTT